MISDEIQTLFDVHFSQLKCQLKHHPLPPTPRCLFHPSSALRAAQYNCGYAEQWTGWESQQGDHGMERGRSWKQHPCQNKYTSIKYKGWYQSYQFVLHHGCMRNTADFTCITCSVCPTVTNLFQTRNKYFNTNSNR